MEGLPNDGVLVLSTHFLLFGFLTAAAAFIRHWSAGSILLPLAHVINVGKAKTFLDGESGLPTQLLFDERDIRMTDGVSISGRNGTLIDDCLLAHHLFSTINQLVKSG